MMDRIVILLTILIGGGISLALLMGKGSFLIAGYNTASEKEKRKYNEKKLCRTTGTYLALITVLVLGAEIMGENIPDWYLALTTGGVFIGLIPTLLYANLGCRIKPGEEILLEESPEKELKRKKARKTGTIITILITGAALVFSAVLLFTGNVEVVIQNDQLEIRGLTGQTMSCLFQKYRPLLTGRTLKQAVSVWESTVCSLMRELFKTKSLESTPYTAMPDVKILW